MDERAQEGSERGAGSGPRSGPDAPRPSRVPGTAAALLVLALSLIATHWIGRRSSQSELTYSEFKLLLHAGKIRDEAHTRVRDTLMAHRAVLDSLARLLMEREVVDRAMLRTLLEPATGLASAVPPPGLVAAGDGYAGR